MYGTRVYVYACTIHACACMHVHVRYTRVRVCIYGTCVYVYVFTVHACTCMHVRYTRVRVCMYSTRVYSCMGLAYINLYAEVQVRVHLHDACMYAAARGYCYVIFMTFLFENIVTLGSSYM